MAKEKKGVRMEHISEIYQDPKTGRDFYAVKDTSLEITPGSFVTPSPAQSPARPTAPAPFQRSGGRSSGRSAAPGCPLEAGAQAVGPPWGERQLS